MKRNTNITTWQIHLFEGLDQDVMVMQRDEQEVFDEAIHVFFDKEYYDTYVTKAKKYSDHRFAYHEDKLGEVIYQIFDEDIPGLVLHIVAGNDGNKNTLYEDKYLSKKELRNIAYSVNSYHHLYTASIDRMPKEQAVAELWMKDIYIIGQLPAFSNTAEPQRAEFMTMKRMNDGTPATPDSYDYEAVKVFLTEDSANKFNPDGKPVNRYKLGLLATFVKGKLRVIIEPHRRYYLEFDPASIDISEYNKMKDWTEETVKEKIKKFTELEEVYILLSVANSDYRKCVGTPFIIRMDGVNTVIHLFEKYDDAVSYVIQNQNVLPVLDGIHPIGVLKKSDNLASLRTMMVVAAKAGIQHVTMDFDTVDSIVCQVPFFNNAAEYGQEYSEFLTEEECKHIEKYAFPLIPFAEEANNYEISDERKEEIKAHLSTDSDCGVSYISGCNLSEIIYLTSEAGKLYDSVRNEENEENKQKFAKLLNQLTVPLTDALSERPYIFTLRNEDRSFVRKNDFPYLIITNRFESGRNTEGRLMPAGIENETFMKELEEASKVAIVTDGPNVLCLADVHLMAELMKQKKKSESLKAELIIYMVHGCGLSYVEAEKYYKRLKSDSNIFAEFTSSVRNGEYSPMCMTVEGCTAKQLAEDNDLNMLMAYETLLSLKVNPDTSVIKKETEKEVDAKDEKKGLFGRLFK